MGNYETLNELLVTLFRDVMDIEQKVIITPEFKDITNNDMHVIEAIGSDPSFLPIVIHNPARLPPY